MARNYKEEYAHYQGTPQQIKNRTLRNAARRLMIKKYGKKKLKGKDIDHIKHVASGGTNSRSNLRIRSIHANRADNGQ